MTQPRPEDLAELWHAADQPEPLPASRPAVRILLRPEIIDEPGWLEIRSTVALWVAAGDARLEQGSGTPVPAAELAALDDVRDLYGLRLILLEPSLAATAAATLNVVLRRPDLDHTLDPALRDV